MGDRALATRILTCTTIGTCRIADPLGAVTQIRKLQRSNANIYGFTHTSKEALQQIDFLEGRDLPPELSSFLSAEGVFPRGPSQVPDCFVVEISSTKEIRFRDYYLQINYFERTFRERPELYDTFTKLKAERDLERRRQRFEALESFTLASDLEKTVLLEGWVHQTTREELEADMMTIVERLPAPVVFVSHINVPGSEGTLIASRDRLCAWVREICQARRLTYFDPTPHVTQYGQARALAEDGKDLKHYSRDFKPVLGSILFDEILTKLKRPGPGRITVEVERTAPKATPSSPAPEREAPRAEAAGPSPARQTPKPKPAVLRVATDGAPIQVNAALSEAKRRIADGDLDEAEAILHGVVAEDPRSAQARTLLGTIAFHRGDTTAATAEFREALQLDSAATEPRLMLVKSALRMGRPEEACSIAVDLVRRCPDDTRVLLAAAKAMMRAKRYGEAVVTWQRLAVLRPDLIMPHVEIARCEMKARNFEAALAAANVVLARDPRDASALVIKSDALLRLKRMRELAEVSLELAKIEPRAAMAAVPALISALHPEEAARIVATARETDDVDIDAVMRAALIQTLERRGRVAAEREDAQAAAAAWKAILLIDPASTRATSGLRRLFGPLVSEARGRVLNGDFAGAIAIYESALAIDPDNARILRELANLHEKAGNWQLASQNWAHLARVSEGSVEFKARAARAAMRGQQFELAARLFHELRVSGDAQTDDAFTSAMRKLVRSMRDDFAAGHLDVAASKARTVLALDPGSEPGQRVFRKVMATYARRLRAVVAAGDTAAQEELCFKMLALDPNWKGALKVLAKLYRTAKRHRDGIEVLQRLTEIEPEDTRHWIKLARSCRAVRLYDRGVPAALKALEMEPGDPATVSLLSDMLNRQAAA